MVLVCTIRFLHHYLILLTNPPLGTCVPIAAAAFLLHLLGVYRPVLIFVESFCRVKSLSLSGQLLYPIVDSFVVQWPQLAERYPRAEYLGKIC